MLPFYILEILKKLSLVDDVFERLFHHWAYYAFGSQL